MTSYILSTNLIKFDPHQHSNNRWFVFLASHPGLCVCSCRGHVNILQWYWECFFLRHAELNSRFNMMTINKVSFNRTEVVAGFSVVFGFCWLRPFELLWSSSQRCSLPSGSYCLRVDSRMLWSLPSNFAVPSSIVNFNFSSFCTCFYFLCIELSSMDFLRAFLPAPQCLQPEYLPSRFSPQPIRIRGICLGRLSFQIDGFLTGLWRRWENTQPLLRTERSCQ